LSEEYFLRIVKLNKKSSYKQRHNIRALTITNLESHGSRLLLYHFLQDIVDRENVVKNVPGYF
jgi:hypothetical protein